MRRTVTILAAALVLLLGMGTISAFEAHMVNVRAHVENAISVTPDDNTENVLTGETVFPQEWRVVKVDMSLSSSFQAQSRVNSVDYKICAEESSSQDNVNFFWLGDAMYVGIDVQNGSDPNDNNGATPPFAYDMTLIGADPGPAAAVCPGLTGTLTQLDVNPPDGAADNLGDELAIALDVPVCAENYNPLTDPTPKPSGLNAPTLVLVAADPRHNQPDCQYQGGVDVTIQVTGIT